MTSPEGCHTSLFGGVGSNPTAATSLLGPDEAGTSMLERGPSGGLVGGDLGGVHLDGGTWNLSWIKSLRIPVEPQAGLSQA